jgi:signal transduction histidine kinase/CheY-like chemotaxis protein
MEDESAHESLPLQEDMANLQRGSLALISLSMIVFAFGLLCVAAGNPEIGGPKVWLIAGPLLAIAGVAWRLNNRSYSLASVILCVGLIFLIFIASSVYAALDVLFAVPIAIFILPVLLDYRAAAAITAGTIGLISLGQSVGITPLSGTDSLVIGILCAVSAGFAWIAYRPTHLALTWALLMLRSERRASAEIRERQSELTRVSKSFSDACDRLERANATLAQARREAEQARRLKEEFATAISHELRTPLNLIIGFSEIIARDPTTEEGSEASVLFRDDLEIIYRNACHLSDLIDDVLDLGRLDAHRLALQKKWSDLSSIVGDAVTAVDGLYRKTELQLVIDLPSDLPRLFVDATRIRQVLINLLANAVRYTDEGSVRISARRDGGEVILSVEDTGAGIPADDLPYVFEGFRQAGNPHRRGGFGIGLTVSKRFVEMHAGAMWVESEPGRGTTFFLSLPVMDNVAAIAGEPRRRMLERHYLSQPNHRAILVLDPDIEVGRAFQRYLDGYRVHLTTTILEARQVMNDEAIHAVIVSDPTLSADDGLDLAGSSPIPRVPAIRCVVRSAQLSGRELGVAAFLTKPINQDQLLHALTQLELEPRRVLIVEDDPAMVDLLSRMLRTIKPGCEVETAGEGEQGLALARNSDRGENLDLVLLDLLMPGVDGHQFLREWQSDPRLREIPVVVVSAASEEGHDLIVGSSIEIQRVAGLSVGDLTRLVRDSLDCLLGGEATGETGDSSELWRDLAESGRFARTSQSTSASIGNYPADI